MSIWSKILNLYNLMIQEYGKQYRQSFNRFRSTIPIMRCYQYLAKQIDRKNKHIYPMQSLNIKIYLTASLHSNQRLNIYLLIKYLSIMTTKAPQVTKAAKTAKATKKGVLRRKYKVRSSLRFYKPNTLRVASKPKYDRTRAALKLAPKFDKYSVLVQPLNTQKANKSMTERNTLTFLVHNLSNKVQIRRAFKDIFNVVPRSVNTLVRPDGKKKAFIRLRPEDEAVSIASKIGII